MHHAEQVTSPTPKTFSRLSSLFSSTFSFSLLVDCNGTIGIKSHLSMWQHRYVYLLSLLPLLPPAPPSSLSLLPLLSFPYIYVTGEYNFTLDAVMLNTRAINAPYWIFGDNVCLSSPPPPLLLSPSPPLSP